MKSKSGTIFLSGLIAGTLDILAAVIIYAVVLEKTTAIKILQSIASGVFKKEAYTGGSQMAWLGLGLHYLIAFIFAWFYFIVYPYFPFLKKNLILSGALYGIFVWIVMNLIVLPITFPLLPEKHFDFPLLLSILILIFCIGLPIASVTRKFYAFR
ncbi:hypothetical protein FLA105534_01308 [Flavobacterium bizetiae]|uniref:DUF1440 domain-containing protein n=1 Tax=Flavobacterium bizetiae TaxID=2704140 RepID=A0A6J4GC52_9FLAO|nr:DUF1440 domain-containing protein [Flavobacterium bizetiae]CAA9196783.1 hypothetical protein FLA105534_01308 [Flavobacterium bizetiae]CAD5342431.1 hypothetical protein FLA105535_02418 [Flavobacterium bizetiae]CAD5348347.1 hypothetical protein FLA105534_02310 [Flavobacterium bizetiae]